MGFGQCSMMNIAIFVAINCWFRLYLTSSHCPFNMLCSSLRSVCGMTIFCFSSPCPSPIFRLAVKLSDYRFTKASRTPTVVFFSVAAFMLRPLRIRFNIIELIYYYNFVLFSNLKLIEPPTHTRNSIGWSRKWNCGFRMLLGVGNCESIEQV